MRFLYPEAKRPLAELKSDLAHVYQIPVDNRITVAIRISATANRDFFGMPDSRGPGALSQPALIFTAGYYDQCTRKQVQTIIRVEKLSVGNRTGIQFSFYNSFRNVYDSGMDIFEGENVVNMGYRLK